MLYNLLYPLSSQLSFLNVFQYITFRTMFATLTALVITMLIGNVVTDLLKKWKLSQITKGYEPKRHKAKEGTPTMGGIMIIGTTALSTLLWADITNHYIILLLILFVGFGLVGFADDYIKTIKRNPEGMRGKSKLVYEILISTIIVYLLIKLDNSGKVTSITLPFLKNFIIDIKWLYLPFAVFIIVGTANAVNLTDGLDGLVTVPAITAFGVYGLFAYIMSNYTFTSYLYLPHLPQTGELAVFCGAMFGAGLGFLWFNTFPATIFMGDVGSLSIGGSLGLIACMVKQEILLAIVGGLFVMEALSVILQVSYFKITHGKRLFRMAPLHHHFELKGWSEPKIIIRFWIITFILAILAISTLKLR